MTGSKNCGSEPKSWSTMGSSSGQVASSRRVPEFLKASPLTLTISEQRTAQPNCLANSRKGRSEYPASGASHGSSGRMEKSLMEMHLKEDGRGVKGKGKRGLWRMARQVAVQFPASRCRAWMCAGVMPQQPPTQSTPRCSRASPARAKPSGVMASWNIQLGMTKCPAWG